MRKLFNNIEQTEKDRILEMHKSATKKNYLMNEQGKNVHPADKAKADAEAAKTAEERKKTEENKKYDAEKLLKNYKNKTVNLYDDEKNTELVKEKVRITKIDLKSDGTLEMELSGFMSGDLIFNCQKPGELTLDKSLGKDSVLYNKNLTSSLQKDFCTKSSGNVDVPKADFASTNRPSGQNFA